MSEAEARNADLAELLAVQGELAAQEEEQTRLREELRSKTDAEEVSKLKSDLQREKEKFKQR